VAERFGAFLWFQIDIYYFISQKIREAVKK